MATAGVQPSPAARGSHVTDLWPRLAAKQCRASQLAMLSGLPGRQPEWRGCVEGLCGGVVSRGCMEGL